MHCIGQHSAAIFKVCTKFDRLIMRKHLRMRPAKRRKFSRCWNANYSYLFLSNIGLFGGVDWQRTWFSILYTFDIFSSPVNAWLVWNWMFRRVFWPRRFGLFNLTNGYLHFEKKHFQDLNASDNQKFAVNSEMIPQKWERSTCQLNSWQRSRSISFLLRIIKSKYPPRPKCNVNQGRTIFSRTSLR